MSGFKMRFCASLLIGILLVLIGQRSVHGGEEVIVRLTAEPESPWIGEKVVLQLDVLGRDGWAQLQKAHDHELRGGYLKRFESQGTRLQETNEGASYTGQRYEYLFFPQQAGELAIDSMEIDVEVKRWGAQAGSEVVRTSTPKLNLHVKSPPGAPADEVLISTSQFRATQNWEPELTEFKVGEAITRTITLEAEDISGMVFPPIQQQDLPGLGIYPSSPTVEDNYNRGSLTGRRVETITYVMEQGGQFSADDLSFTWWNTSTEKLESVTLDGRTFTVKGAPVADTQDQIADVSAGPSHDLLKLVGGVVVLLAGLAFFLKNSIRHWYRAWQEKRKSAEKTYFRRVTQAARSKDRVALLNSAMQWLDRISGDEDTPSRIDLFLSTHGDGDAVNAYVKFCAGLQTSEGDELIQPFYDGLTKARSQWLRARHASQKIEQLLPKVGI